ncbi:MAG: hypothetical protein V7646_2971 [Pseudonocardia sp.]
MACSKRGTARKGTSPGDSITGAVLAGVTEVVLQRTRATRPRALTSGSGVFSKAARRARQSHRTAVVDSVSAQHGEQQLGNDLPHDLQPRELVDAARPPRRGQGHRDPRTAPPARHTPPQDSTPPDALGRPRVHRRSRPPTPPPPPDRPVHHTGHDALAPATRRPPLDHTASQADPPSSPDYGRSRCARSPTTRFGATGVSTANSPGLGVRARKAVTTEDDPGSAGWLPARPPGPVPRRPPRQRRIGLPPRTRQGERGGDDQCHEESPSPTDKAYRTGGISSFDVPVMDVRSGSIRVVMPRTHPAATATIRSRGP